MVWGFIGRVRCDAAIIVKGVMMDVIARLQVAILYSIYRILQASLLVFYITLNCTRHHG